MSVGAAWPNYAATFMRRQASTLLPAAQFERLLQDHYEGDSNGAARMMEDLGEEMDLNQVAMALPEPEDLLESADDAPIIRLINALLTEAIKENASDIHIESFENRLLVRFRVDGVLREALQPPWLWGRCWCRGSRLWRTWISLKNVCHKMGGFRSRWPGDRWMCGSRLCRPDMANGWCCDCWTSARVGWICSIWGWNRAMKRDC